MKKTIILFVLIVLVSGLNYITSQNLTVKESVDSINAILKANPYIDRFNDITFSHTVDITQDKELVVVMNFDGPFKWVYKVKISDLDIAQNKNACLESLNSICWVCKPSDTGETASCVEAAMVYTDGGSTVENSSNICVSFSGQRKICNELNNRFQLLFTMIQNNSQ